MGCITGRGVLIPRKYNMKNRFQFAAVFALVLAPFAFGACSSTVDEVDQHFDCNAVCHRYADCFDSAYDVDGCKDKCDADADKSDARQAKLDACHACIDDKSCAGSFTCADKCTGIVP